MQKRIGKVGTINNMHYSNTHAPSKASSQPLAPHARIKGKILPQSVNAKPHLIRSTFVWGPHILVNSRIPLFSILSATYVPIEYNGLVLLHSNICYHWNWIIILLNFCITFIGSCTNQKLHYVKSTLQTWRYVKSALESTFWNKNTKSLFQSQLWSRLRNLFLNT